MTDDEARRAWMEYQLARFADHFGVQILGEPVVTDRLHSAGAAVEGKGGKAWLRVVYADPEWGRGNYLEGNVTANEIDVPRPRTIHWHEWDDNGRTLRGELMTYIAERPIAPDMILVSEPTLGDSWFARLRASLDVLANHPAPRHGLDPDDLDDGIRAFFGVEVSTMSVPWTTAHCDLHWGNLTAPELYFVDWEIWGRAPAGYDAATLRCASLLAPETSNRVHDSLRHHLETPAGQVATLAAAVRFLRFVDEGTYLPLARPLHLHVKSVINAL